MEEVGHIASQTTWNLNVGVEAPWNGKLQVGVKNMFNVGPSLESDDTYDDVSSTASTVASTTSTTARSSNPPANHQTGPFGPA